MTELLNYYLKINISFGRAVDVMRKALFRYSRTSPLTKAVKPHMKIDWQRSVWVCWGSALHVLRDGVAQSVWWLRYRPHDQRFSNSFFVGVEGDWFCHPTVFVKLCLYFLSERKQLQNNIYPAVFCYIFHKFLSIIR